MFENSEKLLFFLVIALLFLGPEKMAGLGTALGRAIRDFRSTMRGAQETFHSEFSSAAQELSSPAIEPSPALLPSPDSAASEHQDAAPVSERAPETPKGAATPPAAEFNDQSSLASEPTAHVLAEQRSRTDRARGC